MTAPITCPVCETAQVLQAQDAAGAPFYLSPRPYPKGKYAAREDGGVLRVRLLTETRPVRDDEVRYSAHNCDGRSGGLAEVRKAQARAAAQARNRRGRPARRDPLAKAIGVRMRPPGSGAG